MNEQLFQIVGRIRACESAVIACHRNPDGDAIGSLLALGLALRKSGKTARVICHDEVPARFRFLPMANEVTTAATADLGIAVDAASLEQLGTSHDSLQRCNSFVKIDHHAEGDSFGDLEWVDTNAAAVGEMLVDLCGELDVALDVDIAQCLLTAIVTDTGSFRFANTRSATFAAASKLMTTGVDFASLVERIYWDRPFSSAHLTGLVMSRAQTAGDGEVVWSYLTNDDFVNANGTASDADHLSNELRSIEGVQAAALFRETPESVVRVSLRSRGGVDVAAAAQKFGGGGHRNAAGCRYEDESVRQQIIEEVVRAVKVAQSSC